MNEGNNHELVLCLSAFQFFVKLGLFVWEGGGGINIGPKFNENLSKGSGDMEWT